MRRSGSPWPSLLEQVLPAVLLVRLLLWLPVQVLVALAPAAAALALLLLVPLHQQLLLQSRAHPLACR